MEKTDWEGSRPQESQWGGVQTGLWCVLMKSLPLNYFASEFCKKMSQPVETGRRVCLAQ